MSSGLRPFDILDTERRSIFVDRTQRAHEVTRLQRIGGGALAIREALDEPVISEAAIEPTDGEGIASMNGQTVRPVNGVSRIVLDRSLFHDRPIVMPDDTGPAAHAYRMLRTQLLQRVRQHRARTIGIVSAADREGKTLTATNLALSLAVEPNQSVLLVDLDLHRPSVASTLKLRVGYGLDSWFAGRITDVDKITYPVEGFERLSILPTLNGVPGSSEALSNLRAQEMLAELKASQPERLILFDLPPLLLTDDYLTIASHLDGVIVVAREGHTKREDLTRMTEILGSVRLLGTVLNHSTQFERRAY
jgi:Mrp family chromosome partitioning ATPase